jgi:hypothetical protein
MHAARGHMDEPGSGLAGRGSLTELKSPLPDSGSLVAVMLYSTPR